MTRPFGFACVPTMGEAIIHPDAPGMIVNAPWAGDHNHVMVATEAIGVLIPRESFARLMEW